MFWHVCRAVNADGKITACKPNPAVMEETLQRICQWKRSGANDSDIGKLYNFLDFIQLSLKLQVHIHVIVRLSLLLIHRDIANIRGMTRETLIALTTNIESREQKRCYNVNNGLPQEHPRASSTDDVECFFSINRDQVGKHFTYKDAWRKCCIEFSKHLQNFV